MMWLWWHFWLYNVQLCWLFLQPHGKGKKRCRSHHVQPPYVFIRDDTVLAFMTFIQNKLKTRRSAVFSSNEILGYSSRWRHVCLSVCGMMCVPFHVGLSEDKDIYLFSEGVSVLNEWGAYPSLTVEHSPHQVWNSSGPGLRHITPCQDHCEQLFNYWSLFKWKSETLIDDKINHISKLLSMVSPVSKNICIMSGVLLTWTLETESRSDKRESLNFIEVQY